MVFKRAPPESQRSFSVTFVMFARSLPSLDATVGLVGYSSFGRGSRQPRKAGRQAGANIFTTERFIPSSHPDRMRDKAIHAQYVYSFEKCLTSSLQISRNTFGRLEFSASAESLSSNSKHDTLVEVEIRVNCSNNKGL